MGRKGIILFVGLVVSNCCFSQQQYFAFIPENEPNIFPENLNNRSINIGDSVFIIINNCKSVGIILIPKKENKKIINNPLPERGVARITRAPLLRVHGNLLYNFNYRSYIDTPFAQNDLMQHFIQSRLTFVVKDKYPIDIILTSRNSNSPYFKNAVDVSVQFDRGQLLKNIKKEYTDNLTIAGNEASSLIQKTQYYPHSNITTSGINKFVNIEDLRKYCQELQMKKEALQGMPSWVNGSSRVQEMVEEKEKALRSEAEKTVGNEGLQDELLGTARSDGAENIAKGNKAIQKYNNSFIAYLEAKTQKKVNTIDNKYQTESITKKIDSVQKEIERLTEAVKKSEAKIKSEQKKIRDSINMIKREINSLSTGAGLYTFMHKYNIDKRQLTSAQRILLSINRVGIGRSQIDYSELTVKNISLTGVNVEMNPLPFYFAAAAGRVNYRFRDFVYKNDQSRLPSQSVAMLRVGVGQKEKNNFIISFYSGKKTVLNSLALAGYNGRQNVMGISAESRIAINANNYLVMEFAKSSYYKDASDQPTNKELRSKTMDFGIRSNEAYSIKLFSSYPATNTRITAYYRKSGEHFQSFTLYPSGVNLESWMARISQSFWKKKVSIDMAIRKNDFVSPIAAPSFNSKTVFKSLQLTVRVPKYPYLSVGYYPSSQLLIGNNNVLMESQYNTFNAVMSYSYVVGKKVSMNSGAVYTKFYNSSSDTGFIYFNAESFLINHNIYISRLQLQSGITFSLQREFRILTLEQNAGYQFKRWMNFTGGIKWIKQDKLEGKLGATAGLSLFFKKYGTIQFHYDKTYLPGYNRSLRQMDMGSISFYRIF